MTEFEAFQKFPLIARPYYNERIMKDYTRAKFVVLNKHYDAYLVYADTGVYFKDDVEHEKLQGRNDWLPLNEALENYKKEMLT